MWQSIPNIIQTFYVFFAWIRVTSRRFFLVLSFLVLYHTKALRTYQCFARIYWSTCVSRFFVLLPGDKLDIFHLVIYSALYFIPCAFKAEICPWEKLLEHFSYPRHSVKPASNIVKNNTRNLIEWHWTSVSNTGSLSGEICLTYDHWYRGSDIECGVCCPW